MKLNIKTSTVYELVVFPPGSESKEDWVRYQSRSPFNAIARGDEITAAMLGEEGINSSRPVAIVRRVVREVTYIQSSDEILDTTWTYTSAIGT